MESSESLDKFTLECMMDKRKYNKYIQKTNPQEFKQRMAYLRNVAKHKPTIMEMIEHIFDEDPTIPKNISTAFNVFVQECVYHLNIIDNENQILEDYEQESDVMCDTVEEQEKYMKTIKKTYW